MVSLTSMCIAIHSGGGNGNRELVPWPKEEQQESSIGLLSAWVSVQPLYPRTNEYTTRDLYEGGSGEVPQQGEQEPGQPDSEIPIQEGDLGVEAKEQVREPSIQAESSTGGQVLTRAEVAAIACTPEREWSCADVLTVVFGPTALCPNGESGGDASAVNGNILGLGQIHEPSHRSKIPVGGSLLDPVVNIQVMYSIWKDQGWAPWDCRP